jgi:cell division septation protein DedD
LTKLWTAMTQAGLRAPRSPKPENSSLAGPNLGYYARPTIMNEHYEFSFERGQLMKLAGGLLSLVLLVFSAGLLVGLSYQIQGVEPAFLVENQKPQPTPVAKPVVAEPAPVVETPATDLSEEAIEAAIDPDLPAIDPADSKVAAASAVHPIDDDTFAVQLGAFLQSQNAGVFARKIAAKGYETDIVAKEDSKGRTWYLVRHGSFSDRSEATAVAVRLHVREGFDAVVRPANQM